MVDRERFVTVVRLAPAFEDRHAADLPELGGGAIILIDALAALVAAFVLQERDHPEHRLAIEVKP